MEIALSHNISVYSPHQNQQMCWHTKILCEEAKVHKNSVFHLILDKVGEDGCNRQEF